MKLGLVADIAWDAASRLREHLAEWWRDTRLHARVACRTPEEREANRKVVDQMVRETRRTRSPSAWTIN